VPEIEADEFLEQELVRVAVLGKHLEATSWNPELASLGYNISAVFRTRVLERMERSR